MTCHACGTSVPAGTFCGTCGADATQKPGPLASLRLRAHAVAPDEHVLLPWLVTSLFPHVERRSRWAFRTALLILLAMLFAFAALRWQPPLIGLSALWLVLLFGLQLRETDALRDQSVPTLAGIATLAAALGVGWALATEAMWKRTYDDVLGTPMTNTEALINLLAIPVAGVLVMLAPIALVRVLRPGARESLDGFVIGALSAICFTAAGVLTRATPEFTHGLTDLDIPLGGLFSLTTVRGVAGPLTAAAVGGMVGATLWFTPRTSPKVLRHWYSPTSAVTATAIALLVYLAQNAIDYAWISYAQIVALYLAVTAIAVLALRMVVHATLRTEAPDEGYPDGDADEPVLCPQCDHVVPDLAFCACCGIAARAASRTSRAARRGNRPIPAPAAPESQPES